MNAAHFKSEYEPVKGSPGVPDHHNWCLVSSRSPHLLPFSLWNTNRQKPKTLVHRDLFTISGPSSPLQYVWMSPQLHDTKSQLIGRRLLPWNVAVYRINENCRISPLKNSPAHSPAMKNVRKLSSMSSSSSWVMISSGILNKMKRSKWPRVQQSCFWGKINYLKRNNLISLLLSLSLHPIAAALCWGGRSASELLHLQLSDNRLIYWNELVTPFSEAPTVELWDPSAPFISFQCFHGVFFLLISLYWTSEIWTFGAFALIQ